MSRKKGFTLIELMVVIVIVGFIACLAMPSLVKSRYSAQLTSCQSNMRSMSVALEGYATDYNKYPKQSTWQEDIFKPSGGSASAYMEKEPRCPSNASNYNYSVETDFRNSFTLTCNGIHYMVLKDVADGFPQFNSAGNIRFK